MKIKKNNRVGDTMRPNVLFQLLKCISYEEHSTEHRSTGGNEAKFRNFSFFPRRCVNSVPLIQKRHEKHLTHLQGVFCVEFLLELILKLIVNKEK